LSFPFFVGLSSHRFDFITLNSDKLHATFALKTQNEVFGGAKASVASTIAGTKARALILLLTKSPLLNATVLSPSF
jgi:hypothetical protein